MKKIKGGGNPAPFSILSARRGILACGVFTSARPRLQAPLLWTAGLERARL